ncbi:MAG: hypothetical protein B6U89_00840 [Desulfurococcales archaeon ex4484_58]|nr:MAG: hypothetical protein B6U89_00840 [Desulfurococcales archaeon ex4484_58]
MYDLFLRMTREEILSPKPISLSKTKINEYKSFMNNALIQLAFNDRSTWKYFDETIFKTIDDLRLFAKFRLAKTLLSSFIPKDSLDKNILDLLDRFIELYVNIYSSFTVKYEEKFIIMVKNDTCIDNILYRKGDILMLDEKDVIKYYLLGVLDFIKEPYILEKLHDQGERKQ